MRKSTFIKHLSQLDEEGLKIELETLYDRIDQVKTYYKVELGSEKDRAKIIASTKKEILSKFRTKSKRRPRRPRIQKLHSVLKKANAKVLFDYEMIEFYLYATETGIDFMNEYNFYSDTLERNLKIFFTKSIDLIESSLMAKEYSSRCLNIIEKIHSGDGLKTFFLSQFKRITN